MTETLTPEIDYLKSYIAAKPESAITNDMRTSLPEGENSQNEAETPDWIMPNDIDITLSV